MSLSLLHRRLPDVAHRRALGCELAGGHQAAARFQRQVMDALAIDAIRARQNIDRRLRHEIDGGQRFELSDDVGKRHELRIVAPPT